MPFICGHQFWLGWLVLVNLTISCISQHLYSHQWAVEITGGEQVAKDLADKHNFEYLGPILGDVHHFQHRRISKRSLKPSHTHHEALLQEPQVRWAEQQKVLRRSKRDFEPSRLISTKRGLQTYTVLTDPKWASMWYLNRGGELDMNVEKAWAVGATGKAVVVTILDDGLEKDHPDLLQNYDPRASYDVNARDPDPMPRYDARDTNRHGTRCAGEVAAVANNSNCAVGVAYEASVGGVRMLDGDVTDAVEARSLSLNPNHIDIYSASWGPDDDGKTVDGPGQMATRAFYDGITNGRNGKGSIFVWASGNGGRDKDNCNCDGYTNSIWTLSISSATEKGKVPWYSEACSSTLASTYSSGSFGERQIITTDLHHKCTSFHTGTSASAPLAAGICALALHANSDLTWRDMQHIVVRTARPQYLDADDWQTNGVGRKVSHRFGYGIMDAHGMVQLARNWTTVPPQRKCEVSAPHTEKLVPQQSYVTLDLEVSDCPGVNFLEHVQSKVTLTADERGKVEIFLISPAGTRSHLLALRPKDGSRHGFHSWPFMTVHMWGEQPLGIWKLEIHNSGGYYTKAYGGTLAIHHKPTVLVKWGLVFHGTNSDPRTKPKVQPKRKKASLKRTTTTPTTSRNINSSFAPKVMAEDWSLIFYGTEVQPGTSLDDSVSYGGKESLKESLQDESSHSLHSMAGNPGVRDKGEDTPVHGIENSANSVTPSVVSRKLTPDLPLPLGCLSVNESGLCIECKETYYQRDGACLVNCPEGFFAEENNQRKYCSDCHYSCLNCSGPLDYQCTICWPDATKYSPKEGEVYCHSKDLINSLQVQKTLARISLVLLVCLGLAVFVLAILTVLLKKRQKPTSVFNNVKFPNTGTPTTKLTANYRQLVDEDGLPQIPFKDMSSSDEEM